MAIFYHLSTLLSNEGLFTPRVPDHRVKGMEEDVTPRVCVAETIEGCLSALPRGRMTFSEANFEHRGYYQVFEIDTDKLGIPEEAIIASEVLYERDWVRDAGITGECWITVPFTVPQENMFFMKLVSWEECQMEIAPFSLVQLANEKYGGNYYKAGASSKNDTLHMVSDIRNISYQQAKAKKGESLTLHFGQMEEREAIWTYIEKHYAPELVQDNGKSELTFRLNQDADLYLLFAFHLVTALRLLKEEFGDWAEVFELTKEEMEKMRDWM